ncbi:ERF family protein [Tolypothrix sp. NIES-4075]|uniref:ERF family protein n=1 Tax=Tolypothrix sp. NIES-4075 TaxID=2005459 RepID=UPI000B5C9435|nr:ERF family protein [Tolypothrix sp. NIES-4075]GAX45765.1 ERF family protein [Tolypothrix sp. NIES-4075]
MTPQLNTALSKAKSEFPVILANKNVRIPTKSGREISFTYAELEEILPTVTPILSTNGLVILHQMQFVADKYCLVSSLRHESGEQVESVFLLPQSFDDPKELGNKISYGRRYNTLCLLDIIAVDDVHQDEKRRKFVKDFKEELGMTTKPSRENNGSILHSLAGVSTEQKISEAQGKRLWAIARNECKLQDNDVRAIFAEFKIESTADIPISKYQTVIDRLHSYNAKF